MFVKEVEIDGFKSYAQATTVSSFDRHFNAITGLNGSGKSNILDSICFVLGITNLTPHALTSSQVAALIQLLRDDDHIKPPSAKCLSPAGEYNMRLGKVKDYTIV